MAGTFAATVAPLIVTEYRTATLTASGTLATTDMLPSYTQTAPLAGTGALAGAATARYARAATLAGAGALAATGSQKYAPTFALAATGTLSTAVQAIVGMAFVSAASAASTTLTMPAHQAGDLLLLYAFRDGSTSPAAVPSDNWTWQWQMASTSSPCCLIQSARVCTSSSETPGTVVNATGLAVALYRKPANAEWVMAPDGPWKTNGYSTSTITFTNTGAEPFIIPAITDHWYVRAAGHRTATNLTTATLTGWSSRTGVPTELRILDTGTKVTTLSAYDIGDYSFAVNATSGWAAMTAWLGIRVISGMPLFVGSFGAGGTTSVSPMPAHQAGDLLITTAYRYADTTAPSLPAGWTNIQSGGGFNCGMRTAYKIATSSSETSGAWTNASQVLVEVWRNAAIGVSAVGGNTSAGITYPALTLSTTGGTSRTYVVAGHRAATDVALNPAFVGNGSDFNAGGGVTGGFAAYHSQTAWTTNQASQGQTVNASAGWRAHSVEIKYSP